MSNARFTADADLQALNSLSVSSFCSWFATIDTLPSLVSAARFAEEHGLSILPIGEGTNIVLNESVKALVLKIALRGRSILQRDSQTVLVEVAAGENWHDFVLWTLQQQAAGLENLALIPGTCGAAPIQNIGAYGVELDQFVDSVEVFDLAEKNTRYIAAKDCDFSYRESIFKQALMGKVVVTALRLRLHSNIQYRPSVNYPALAEYMQTYRLPETAEAVCSAVCDVRRQKLPDPKDTPNVGSFFKNPVIDQNTAKSLKAAYPDMPMYETEEANRTKVPAAWLIDKAGWKGYSEGGVGVHTHQALVLINPGRRPATDVLALASKIAASVEDKFAIQLEREPRVIG